MLEDEMNQNIARPELLQIAESVAREKSIDPAIVIDAMEEAIETALKDSGQIDILSYYQ